MRLMMNLAASLFVVAGDADAADSLATFARFDAGSAIVIDNDDYAAFLAKHVRVQSSGQNLVAYGAVGQTDKAVLAAYIAQMETIDPSALNRDEAFAYWVNLYNALTLKVLLDHYPLSSIRKIRSGPLSFGPWEKEPSSVAGVPLSLNDIEHRILRAHFSDNRVHYALNCASIGCPNLKASPWTAANLDADLDAAARAFINSPRGVAISDGKVTASSIYDWYRQDFGRSDTEVLAHLARYADPALATDLARATKISDYRYDWSLNDAGPRNP